MKYDPFLLRVSGKVTISVKAEAMQSSILCGKNAVFVPQKGRIDTIIKTLLVQVITILLLKKIVILNVFNSGIFRQFACRGHSQDTLGSS